MWTLWKMLTSIEGHSGYQFPWFPIGVVPFTYGSAYHDFHHTKNVGNYATRMYLFELLLGTNDCFFNHEFDKVQNNKNGTEKINQN
jgi:sterol desaturase/sphingolipid hydroxylase (fatty acid hydroxylase superfamily)